MLSGEGQKTSPQCTERSSRILHPESPTAAPCPNRPPAHARGGGTRPCNEGAFETTSAVMPSACGHF
eukprot:7134322-Alexandrium_andersonii.AAC.1